MNVDLKPAERTSELDGVHPGCGPTELGDALPGSGAKDDLATRGGCLMGLGKLLGMRRPRPAVAELEIKYKPRHRLRPVSSCSGRIMTVLLADQNPVANVEKFAMEELFCNYRPLIETFKDELITVPNIWLLMNYKYELKADIENLRLDKPDPATLKVSLDEAGASKSDILYNLRVVRHNFDIPHYLREFISAIKSRITADQIAAFGQIGTEWLQDPFYVLQSPENEITIMDPHYVPPGYTGLGGRFLRPILTRRFLAREIAASENSVLKPTPYFIEGGNILADQNFLVMGADSFIDNWEKFHQQPFHSSFEEMHEQLCRDFGVDYILIPGLVCPPEGEYPLVGGKVAREAIRPQHKSLFHLDLFMALGGYNPRTGKEIVFVAECYEKLEGQLQKMRPRRNHCLNTGKGLNEYLDEVADWFEHPPEYAASFAQRALPATRKERKASKKWLQLDLPAFEVHRVPCYFDVDAGEMLVSYVNGHFENYRVKWRKEPVMRAYLPDYGGGNGEPLIAEVMEMARKAYQKAGFLPIPVKFGLDERISKGGSFHCMTKVMQRYPYDSSGIRDSESYVYVPSKDNDTGLKKFTNFWANAWQGITAGIRFRKDD